MRERSRQSGFTLIELMVVVLIIGLISSIAIPVFGRAMKKAHRAAVGGSLTEVHKAMSRYYADNGAFPTLDPATFEPLVAGGYLDSADSLLSKFEGNSVMTYADMGAIGYYIIVRPKGDFDSFMYDLNLSLGPASTVHYDGVYWYNPTETPFGIARLDGTPVWIGAWE